MKDTIKYLVWIFAIVPFLIACGDSNTDDAPTDDFDVRFELPATVDVSKGGELTFTVKEGKSPIRSSWRGGEFPTSAPSSEHLLRVLPSA